MINVESRLVIVDNTKIHDGRCVHIFGGFKHKYAKVGNFILVSVKNKLENKKTRIKLYLAVITATRFKKIDNSRLMRTNSYICCLISNLYDQENDDF